MQKKYTKNIHLYSVDNKFNKNIFETNNPNISVMNIPNNQSIHKYFYTKNITDNFVDTFIFNSSIINNEVYDFINNFSNTVNIWVFLDNTLSDYHSNIKYISHNPINIDAKCKIIPEYIVNKDLYDNINIKHKVDQIVYFIYNDDQAVLSKIQKYLYPNSKLPIKLFDSDKFQGAQNLGYLNEHSRRDLLIESKYYMHNSSNYYLTEALICGCVPVNIDSDNDLEYQLKNNQTYKPENIIYYTDFVKELCDAE